MTVRTRQFETICQVWPLEMRTAEAGSVSSGSTTTPEESPQGTSDEDQSSSQGDEVESENASSLQLEDRDTMRLTEKERIRARMRKEIPWAQVAQDDEV